MLTPMLPTTIAVPDSTTGQPCAPRPVAAALSLAWREIVRFLRQRHRVFGALGQPIIFWLLFGTGLGSLKLDYVYFFPGTLVMILLFTAIFSTISVIEDRREGFLQSVLVAPLPRWSMVAGKLLGGAALALLQGLLFLALGLLTISGLTPGVAGVLGAVVLMGAISLALCGLGFLLAWSMNSSQGFHAVMMVFLMPMWLLSGAFFPPQAGWLGWVIRLNPLTYGVSGLRQLLGAAQPLAADAPPLTADVAPLWLCWTVTLVFAAAMFALCALAARRTTKGDLL